MSVKLLLLIAASQIVPTVASEFPYGPPFPLEFGATHIADDSDIVKWKCSNVTLDFDSMVFDETTKDISYISILARSCKFIATGPGGIVGLIVALVQGIILIVLGPTIAIYGPTFRRFTCLVQAIVISSYILLINQIISVHALSAFFVFERFVTLVISVLTVTYTTTKSPAGRAKAAGFALGTLIATPLMSFISELLYAPVCGCTGVGKKNMFFPNGEPIGCDLYATDFQVIYQCTLLTKWLIIFAFAYYGEKLINFSTATTGGSMFIKGTIDILKAVGFEYFPDDAIAWLRIITPVRTWGVYGLAVTAYLIQRQLLQEVEKTDDEGNPIKGVFEKKEKQWKLCCMCNPLIKLIEGREEWLKANLESIGSKGAIMKTLTKKAKSPKSNTASV